MLRHTPGRREAVAAEYILIAQQPYFCALKCVY